jgi:3beta-hydroxy-delta5-steroid dehydrogenase/steroid delta-isomerase
VLAADQPGGLRTLALRPGGLWGPGEGCMMIAAFVEQLAAGRFKVRIGDGRALLDNTHVDSASEAHLLAARALARTPERVGGQAYFVTDDEPSNGMEWFRPLVEGLGHAWPRRRIPGGLMLRIAGALEWLHFLGGPEPLLTRRGVLNLIQDACFRIDKARDHLGYEPRVRSAEGLRAIVPEWKARIEAGLGSGGPTGG